MLYVGDYRSPEMGELFNKRTDDKIFFYLKGCSDQLA